MQYLVAITISACFLGSVQGFPTKDDRLSTLIIGGEDALITDVPYMASLTYSLRHLCGASILNRNHVLTAAHCLVVSDLIKYGLRVGTSLINSGEYHRVKSAAAHPKYNSSDIDYDVAVVEVESGFDFKDEIKPILIVPAGSRPLPGTQVLVSGWGITNMSDPKLSEKLQSVELNFFSRKACFSFYQGKIKFTDRMFCAGKEIGGKDSCTSDSGGPLVDLQTGLQVGIVSFVFGCGRPKSPAVYTDLSNVEIHKFVTESSIERLLG